MRHRFNQLVGASWYGWDTKMSHDSFASSTKLCLDFAAIAKAQYLPTQSKIDNFHISIEEMDQYFLSAFVEYQAIDMAQDILGMIQHMQSQGKEVVYTGRGLFASAPRTFSFEAKLRQYYEILQRLHPAELFELSI